jgi:hypothetical protein
MRVVVKVVGREDMMSQGKLGASQIGKAAFMLSVKLDGGFIAMALLLVRWYLEAKI